MKRSSEAIRKARQRDRRRGLGLVEKHAWVHPDDWPAIQAAIRAAARQRQGGAV